MVERTDDDNKLIPTLSRDQVSRGSSYPLSASLISEALREVAQFDRLAISFHARPQQTPLDPEQIPFAGIGCRSPDEWVVWVGAVPSDLAAVARQFASEHGFRYLKAWLDRRRDDTWFLHWHRCTVAIDPIANEGILAELEEQRLVERLPAVPLPPRGGTPSRRG